MLVPRGDAGSGAGRAHHHASGMVVNGEHARASDEAVEQERGLHQRGKSHKREGLAPTGTATEIRVEADGCDYGADFG
ncbi:hypothetical protein [Streptosporangium canum]|uniref:hypothetical protein n=1 Tax=Streptosporangium canum TaxID=324952 RepID=UPI003F4DB334